MPGISIFLILEAKKQGFPEFEWLLMLRRRNPLLNSGRTIQSSIETTEQLNRIEKLDISSMKKSIEITPASRRSSDGAAKSDRWSGSAVSVNHRGCDFQTWQIRTQFRRLPFARGN